MTELRLVFDGPPEKSPSLEIEPKGYALDLGPIQRRADGKSEIVLRFRAPVREIVLDEADP